MKTSLKILILIVVGLIIGISVAYFLGNNYSLNRGGSKVFKQTAPTKYQDIKVFYKKWFKISTEDGTLKVLEKKDGLNSYAAYIPVAHNKTQAEINVQLEQALIEFLIRSCAHSYLGGINIGLGINIERTDVKIDPQNFISVKCKKLEDYVAKFLNVSGFKELIGGQIIQGQEVLDMPNQNFEKILYDTKLREEFLDNLPEE